ncbi:MAG: HypC/HybG/HupF family hydrogenase formation chaperone [Clostridia bacterium]|nr:HypC/HybG/HupF family hydrogenase formation chaperone [Clostridia bacterium]
MCLAVPLKIVEINGKDAVGERHGIRRNIRLDFTESAQLGDYVIAHAGFAIEKMDAAQAEANLAAIREVEDALREL